MGRRMTTGLRVLAIFLLMTVISFPLYWMTIGSFKTFGEHFADRPVFWPEHISFSVFADVLVAGGILRYLANSALVATAAMIFTVLLTVPAPSSSSTSSPPSS